MGRSYSEPKAVQRPDGAWVVQRLMYPDDEFSAWQLMDREFVFREVAPWGGLDNGTQPFATVFESKANIALAAWKAGRDSVYVTYE